MTHELTTDHTSDLLPVRLVDAVPAMVYRAGEPAATRFLEFFTANILWLANS